jgi:hypothetical protein
MSRPDANCSIHSLPKKKSGWCDKCHAALQRALKHGGDEAAFNTRLAIRVERWLAQKTPQNVKPGMGEVAILGMKYLYPPEGVRPDGTRFEVTEKWKK